jgi:hypothetical protein
MFILAGRQAHMQRITSAHGRIDIWCSKNYASFIVTGGGLLWTRQWTFGFHKRRGISWLAKWLLASQEIPCPMKLVISCQPRNTDWNIWWKTCCFVLPRASYFILQNCYGPVSKVMRMMCWLHATRCLYSRGTSFQTRLVTFLSSNHITFNAP